MNVQIVGEITIENQSCYQDLVQILLWNNYGVEIMPIEDGNKLNITIEEQIKEEK